MNIEVRQPVRARPVPAKARLEIVDVDIHPKNSLEDLRPYLSNRWWDYLQTYGRRSRHGFANGYPFPKMTPIAARRDAWPPNGAGPGGDLDFMRAQHLDHYGIDFGVLNPLAPSGQGDQNAGLSAALAFATNECQLARWTHRDKRLKASVVVPYEDPEASVQEIRRRAGDKNFVQVLLLSRTAEALGRKRYWPIFEAAVEAGLPVGIHAFGYSGWAMTGTGWPSFYLEETTEHATSAQTVVTSMVMEGLFERLPALKIIMIECGFGWLPSLGWRLDKLWKTMRDEVPHLTRPPSEYIREHFYVSTQPMEETEDPAHLLDTMRWIGLDRILFATDYPHWDFDDPVMAIPPVFSDAERRMIFAGNAKKLFGLG
jgi:predicted TIM-barrel fold metal-dependent hydrolase